MSQNPLHIGEVVLHGILFDPKNGEALRTMDLDALYKSVPRLFELLDERGVDYLMVGGIAMLAYVEGRNTQDIDLIVSPHDLAKLPEIRIEDQNPEFARGWFGDLQIDFLLAESGLFEKVRRDFATTKRFAERDVSCATVEGLVLLKLYAMPSLYRQGRFAKVRTYEKDIADLVERYRPAIEPLISELAKHMLASDIDEIRKIVAEIENRIARQSTRFKQPND
jgi:hypothetical protein